MKTPSWLWDRRDDSLRSFLLLPVGAAGRVYAAGAWLNRVRHERGWPAARRLGCRVVSVGSPVVGGAGKTPMAAWVAAGLRDRGFRVALATRGHGGSLGPEVRILSDGSELVGDPLGVGDEALVLASQAPGVPVVVGRSRAAAGHMAESVFGIDVLVVDDGFQHLGLARDVDVLVLDAHAGLGNAKVLPRGPLREPLGAVRRARFLGVLDGTLPAEDERLLARVAPDVERFAADRRAVSVRGLVGHDPRPPESLRGRKLGLISGLAQPAAFERTVRALGVDIDEHIRLPDHHRYDGSELEAARRRGGAWLTTEKDAVKILPSFLRGLDLEVLRIELDVDDGARLLDGIEGSLTPQTEAS